ncbi:MAG: DUF262 domain-containing protein [Clostridium fessum]
MIDLNSELMEQKMKVDFNTYDLSVKELLSMVNDGLINIAPEYQRQFRWDVERQSSLVESLFFGNSGSKSFYGNKCGWNLGSD